MMFVGFLILVLALAEDPNNPSKHKVAESWCKAGLFDPNVIPNTKGDIRMRTEIHNCTMSMVHSYGSPSGWEKAKAEYLAARAERLAKK